MARRGRAPYKGLWATPGGFIDRNESGEDAVRREIYEELNMRLGTIRYLESNPLEYPYQCVNTACLELAFFARVQNPNPKAQDDVAEVRFFPLDAIPYRRIVLPSHWRILRVLAAGKIDTTE